MNDLHTGLEPAQMFKRLFPSPERRPDGEYEGKNDGNTDNGEVIVVFDPVLNNQKRNRQADQ